ncbi:CoA transferase [Roseiarcaceae bacterium H3SJ34-1]|uniref:CoA transferase n=1 Tax=Terripilifer ovatus TaxID=3032367 RepID=UPI003AB9792A|nr:CoA transferase [Roseiarcaceae bacterium H3SJ34-1]
MQDLTRDIWKALDGPDAQPDALTIAGEGAVSSAFPVTDFAGASVAAAALAIAELMAQASPQAPAVTVDRRLASFWFGMSIRPRGWTMPPAWDPIAGDYKTGDGWIRLHTNAPHHRAAAQRVLGPQADKAAMAQAVASWRKSELETAIVNEGGCAAEMRSVDDWLAHPQGQAVAAEPLVQANVLDAISASAWVPQPQRPLKGLRVLDLTRVLAGPVGSRFLAGYGADVLRVDPLDWDEPGVIPEVTLGKHCARLDLRSADGRRMFEELLSQADVLLHGYRPGALDGLGYDGAKRRAIAPALIDVSLCAYGWSGPWAGRRGFDSLVQMSAGIAQAGMAWKKADVPTPLPVQALDHATGYLMAAATVRALTRRLISGKPTTARLSLARTAKLLTDIGLQSTSMAFAPEQADDLAPAIEHTAWGEAQRLSPPAIVTGAPMRWGVPARQLGWAQPAWQ